MSILDAIGGVASDLMDDGKVNNSTGGNAMGAVTDAVGGAMGGMDLSKMGDIGGALMSQLGGDHMKQLTDLLGGMNINPADLMSKLSVDQIPMIGDMLKGGNMDGLKGMITGLMGGNK
jgi:hypothetical protein